MPLSSPDAQTGGETTCTGSKSSEKCAERLNVIFARRGNDRSGSMRPARTAATSAANDNSSHTRSDKLRYEEGEKKRERLAGRRAGEATKAIVAETSLD